MAKNDLVTIRMAIGENFIGRGYHFKKGDTAEMTKAEALPFLKKTVSGGKKRFVIVDEEMDALMEEAGSPGDVTSGSDQSPSESESSGKKIVVDPRRYSEPKELRQWLRDHDIDVANNAPMSKMLTLLPENLNEIMEDDAKKSSGTSRY